MNILVFEKENFSINRDSVKLVREYTGINNIKFFIVPKENGLELTPYKEGISGWTIILSVDYLTGYGLFSRETLYELIKGLDSFNKDVVTANTVNEFIQLNEKFSGEAIIAINVKPKTKIFINSDGQLTCNMGPAGKLPEDLFLPIIKRGPSLDYSKNIARFTSQNIAITKKSVGIVIPTVNCAAQLIACINSLGYQNEGYNVKIVFNGSSKETIDTVLGADLRYPILDPVILPKNIGFGKACNIGCSELPYVEYVSFLNDDTILPDNAISNLIEPFVLFDKVGIVGPLSNNIAPKQRVDIKATNVKDFKKESLAWSIKNQPFFDEHMVVGPCLMISSQALFEVGLFDESFDLGNFEDTDLSHRIISAGYKSVIARRVLLYHRGQSTFEAEKIDYNQQYEYGAEIFSKLHKLKKPAEQYIKINFPKDIHLRYERDR